MSEWKVLREQAGLTLAELAAQSGYSIATINGLELRGEGSQRLKDRLTEILKLRSIITKPVTPAPADSVKHPIAMAEQGSEYQTVNEWKHRALTAEKKIEAIRNIINL